jgi:dTDP-4-amino-4,6-dideoxygalactose transaminase
MAAMPQQRVPFLDLNSQILPLRNELDTALQRVVDSCGFILGDDVHTFEQEFADFCGAAHCIGVDSGTSALHVILRALGIGPGDEVILPANTFIATAEAVSHAGALPVLVDVREDTQLLDVGLIEEAITPRTRALIAVHLFGRTADLGPIREITQRRGIHLIEDAAQAHGARYNGQRVGSFGVAAGFSFYPGKNLGAFGDGGAITTNDPDLEQRIRQLRDHGQRQKYDHVMVGFNARLDSLQAAVLRVKLPHLDGWNQARRAHAQRYGQLLQETEYTTPAPLAPQEDHVYHLYVVRHRHRQAVMQTLKDHQIGHGLHYPVPIHLTTAYAHLGYSAGRFPVAEKLADEILSLPMFAELTAEQIEQVCDVLTTTPVSG